MVASISRMQFISGDFENKQRLFRPPWSLEETRFLEVCTGCKECIKACPDGIIVEGRGSYPHIDFSKGYCDFCEDCLTACTPKALFKQHQESPAWKLKAEILDNCLSINAVMCRSCGEVCDERAIRFELKTGGVAIPHLDSKKCTGCGACLTVCPGKSVNIDEEENLRVNAA